MKFSGNSLLFFFLILNTGFWTILCRIPISRMSWLRESTEHVDVVTFYVPLLHSTPLIWKNPDARRKIVHHHNYCAPTAYPGPNLTPGPSPIYLSFNLQREDTGVTAWLTDEPNEAGALIPGTRDSSLQHWPRRLPPAEAGSDFPCQTGTWWHNFSESKVAKYINREPSKCPWLPTQ